jgi:hypothetical protein
MLKGILKLVILSKSVTFVVKIFDKICEYPTSSMHLEL